MLSGPQWEDDHQWEEGAGQGRVVAVHPSGVAHDPPSEGDLALRWDVVGQGHRERAEGRGHRELVEDQGHHQFAKGRDHLWGAGEAHPGVPVLLAGSPVHQSVGAGRVAHEAHRVSQTQDVVLFRVFRWTLTSWLSFDTRIDFSWKMLCRDVR